MTVAEKFLERFAADDYRPTRAIAWTILRGLRYPYRWIGEDQFLMRFMDGSMAEMEPDGDRHFRIVAIIPLPNPIKGETA